MYQRRVPLNDSVGPQWYVVSFMLPVQRILLMDFKQLFGVPYAKCFRGPQMKREITAVVRLVVQN